MRLGNRIYRPGVATVIISKIDTYGAVLRRTHPNFAHTRQNLSLLYICDLHSNRTRSGNLVP